MGKRQKKVSINFDEEILAEIKIEAERLGLSPSQTVQHAIAHARGALRLMPGDGGNARVPSSLYARVDELRIDLSKESMRVNNGVRTDAARLRHALNLIESHLQSLKCALGEEDHG